MGCSNSKGGAAAAGGPGGPKGVGKDGGANGGSRLGVVKGDLRYNMLKATKTANFETLYEVRAILGYSWLFALLYCYV